MIAGLTLFFLLGLLGGSFANAFEYRWYHGRPWAWDRSRCPQCQHLLGVKDLIPLFSWCLLKGKCRYCRHRISWQYPLVELSQGILMALLFFFAQDNFLAGGREFWFYLLRGLFFFTPLLIIFLCDWKYNLIPSNLIYFLALVAILSWPFAPFFNLSLAGKILLAAFSGGIFFALLYFLTRGRGLGWGDVELGLVLGLWLGWPQIFYTIYTAYLGGGLIALSLLLLRRKKIGQTIAFGPFLIAAAIIVYYIFPPGKV